MQWRKDPLSLHFADGESRHSWLRWWVWRCPQLAHVGSTTSRSTKLLLGVTPAKGQLSRMEGQRAQAASMVVAGPRAAAMSAGPTPAARSQRRAEAVWEEGMRVRATPAVPLAM